jgi:pilus assembly protein FimV
VLTTIKILSAQLKLGRESGALVTASRSTLWRTPVAAAALALSLGMGAMDAHALALGRINVLSALGEPLRAEIEVPDINAEEAASLSAKIASGDAFRTAGLEYNAALSTVQISLQRRSNGSAYLRLSSDRPINEPFVDIILETTWATGRVVRDYTMLFDPSNMRVQPAPAITASPSLPGPSANPPPAKATATYTSPATAPVRSTERRTPRAAAPVAAAPAPAAKPGSVTVKAGNTATQLAVRYKPEGISLDQMLVAMLSANPDAFVDGNINRLRKGAVLDMPTAATAGATTPDQARQTITAQSKDFNEFRRRLAQGLPTTSTQGASRKAAGTVQAEVQERKPAAAAPDKLTLSKGAVAGASAPKSSTSASKEDAIAKDKQAKDAASRTAELSKNIQDLNKLVTSTVATPAATASAAAPAATAASSAKPGVAIATGAPSPSATSNAATPTTASPPAAASSAATATAVVTAPTSVTPTASIASTVTPTSVTTATAAAASAPVAQVTPAKPKVTAPPPAPEPSLVDSLMDNPLTMPAAGGLLALLAGFGFYRFRQRKNASQVDSSFLESRLQPDSFFGASGGQRIDTNDAAGAVTGSSMVYSPSQLDAAGDVDPVAEADVYLAYGRDLQAEEILKEAMRTNPSRVAIHAKLMEIYAKRRDIKAFETVANEAFSVTKGQGSEWEAASAMGRDLDPDNPLYQGISMGSMASSGAAGAGMLATGALAATAVSTAFAKQAPSQNAQLSADDNVDFDLDLDFSVNDAGNSTAAMNQALHGTTSPIHVQTTVAMKAQTPDGIDSRAMDLIFDSPNMPDFDASNSGLIDLSPPDLATFDQKLSFPDPKPAMGAIAPTAPMSFTTAPAPAMDALEFDLGDLSLDLPISGAAAASAAANADLSGDPLETKLALAQEFREIGDNDGARSLAQEVASEASGALKARAQRMVADLS